jgi:FMN reductase
MSTRLIAVGLGASPNGAASRSGALLDVALSLLEERGAHVDRRDLSALPADGLLGRVRSPEVEAALASVERADLVLVATPIYRATYSGLLKVFFDLLPTAALAGKVAIPIATGGSPSHQLAIDHGLHPLLASVGAVVVATGVYASPHQFDAVPDRTLIERLERAVDEALALATALSLARRRVTGAEPEITHAPESVSPVPATVPQER